MKFRKAGVPDGLPSLDAGYHPAGSGKACVMELVSVIAGEEWSDHPDTVHPYLAAAGVFVNDRLLDEDRHLLLPLVGRFFGTKFREADVPLRRYFTKQHNLVTVQRRDDLSHTTMLSAVEDGDAVNDSLPFGFHAPCPCPACGKGAQVALTWLSGALDVVDTVRPSDPREVTPEEVLDAFRVITRH